MHLVPPAKEHEQAALGYIAEHLHNGEKKSGGDGGLFKAASYDEWLMKLSEDANNPCGSTERVPASEFFALDENGEIVGMVNIRHKLNEYLLNVDGNIGCGVRPSARNKGFATAILREALEFCRTGLKLDKALITCNKSNAASRKVILKNGGVFESEFIEDNGNIVERYWIAL